MKQNMVILSADNYYAERLATLLNKDADFPFYVAFAKDPEEAEKISKEENIEMLLLDKQLEEKIGSLKFEKLFYLTDIQGYYSLDNVPVIYKFQSVYQIKETLMKYLEMPAEEISAKKLQVSRCNYIGVLSPVGRAYKTSFSLILGALLSQTSRVLFFSLEAFSGFSVLFEKEMGETLSDLLYAEEINQDYQIDEMLLDFHGLKIIPPVRLPEDIYKCNPEKLKELIQKIAREGAYDLVIIDFSGQIQFVEAFSPLLNRIYVPQLLQETEDKKMPEFREWLKRIGKGKEMEIKEVLLPVIHSFVSGKACLEQMMWNEMGDEIRKLLGVQG